MDPSRKKISETRSRIVIISIVLFFTGVLKCVILAGLLICHPLRGP